MLLSVKMLEHKDYTEIIEKRRQENSQELTHFSPRSHPRHLVRGRTVQGRTFSSTSPAKGR